MDPVIETLFLDAGGVLVDPNWGRVSQALARQGVRVEAARLAAAEPYGKRQIDETRTIVTTSDAGRGGLYFEAVLRHAGVALDDRTRAALEELRAYHARHNLWESVVAGVDETLARLRAAGVRCVVVSNANGTLVRHFERLGLSPHFDLVLDSFDVGIEKPDPRFFRLALERSGSRPETTVHVGDFFHVDVVGARAAGLRAVLVDVADLYGEADCPRVRTLHELADWVDAHR
jgi:putative hydrolase of the HAD superfamily